MEPLMRRIIQNRWGYTDEELKKAQGLGFFDVLDFKAMRYWIKADPVCSVHCSACHSRTATGSASWRSPRSGGA